MKKFNDSVNGYDKTEVNSFVAEVTKEYEQMLGKLKKQDMANATLQNKLKHYEEIEKTLNKAVLVAEDSSRQIKKLAYEEAETIIADAKKNASYIVNDALLKAEKTEIEADQLRRSLKIYKARIRETIKEQLTMVDDVDSIKQDDYK